MLYFYAIIQIPAKVYDVNKPILSFAIMSFENCIIDDFLEVFLNTDLVKKYFPSDVVLHKNYQQHLGYPNLFCTIHIAASVFLFERCVIKVGRGENVKKAADNRCASCPAIPCKISNLINLLLNAYD